MVVDGSSPGAENNTNANSRLQQADEDFGVYSDSDAYSSIMLVLPA
jgi:hypothetical protein